MKSLKISSILLLLLVGMGADYVSAQNTPAGITHPQGMTSPCPVKIQTFSYIPPTVEKEPVDEVNLVLTNAVTGNKFTGVSKGGVVSFDSIETGSYKVVLTKEGYYKTRADLLTFCGDAVTGFVNHLVPIWKGDPAKTVNYSLSTLKESAGENSKPTGKFKIAPSDPNTPEVLNGSALVLAKPKYPATAKAIGANGAVNIKVLIDENGFIVDAYSVSGHPLLRSVAVEAARASQFKPTLLSGVPVKVIGIIVYNFQ